MIRIRKSSDRGHADHGWLDTYHSFSFADYYDPAHMSFRSLRVINEDTVAAGTGFGAHGHRDMEIVTYILEGALEHKDSMGNGSVLRRGDVQRMSAGTGVRHSEFNHSGSDRLRLLQIWILPEKAGLTPGYEEKRFDDDSKRNQLRLIAAPGGREGALTIHQDVSLYAGLLDPKRSLTAELGAGRHAWLQLAGGTLNLNGQELAAGDGAAVSGESRLVLTAGDDAAEFLLFDLA